MSDNCRDLFFTETTATALGTYSAYIGDGVNTTYNITHNLNSEEVTYSLRDVQTDVLGYAQINVTGPNTVTISFDDPPALTAFYLTIFASITAKQVTGFEDRITVNVTQPVQDISVNVADTSDVILVSPEQDVITISTSVQSVPGVTIDVGVVDTQEQVNVTIDESAGLWGTITGILSTQTDLWRYLSAETFSPSQLTAFLNSNAISLCSINVNGTILSAGTDLFDIFLTSETDSQTLSYIPSSYLLSISNGNTVNLSSINSLFGSVSGKYESVYSNVQSNSASWNSTTTVVQQGSSNWYSASSSAIGYTHQYFLPLSGGTIAGSLYVLSSVYVAGSAFYVNAQDLIVSDPIIYIAEGNQTDFLDIGIIASWTNPPGYPAGYQHGGLIRRSDNKIWTLFSGASSEPLSGLNVQWSQQGIVLEPLSAKFYGDIYGNRVVYGSLSSTDGIFALGGNSNQWNDTYTNVQANSANWILDGGNTKGADITVGTNDAFALKLESNNTTRLSLLSSGLITIAGSISGLANPTTSFNTGSATGNLSFAVGNGRAFGQRAFAQGNNTIASGSNTAVFGSASRATGTTSFAKGTSTQATNTNSNAEGSSTVASGQASHAEGTSTTAGPGNNSHAEGLRSIASGAQSHAEGTDSQATASNAHAEGDNAQATGLRSHAEGLDTIASGSNSHAEGDATQATNTNAHAEGFETIASGQHSHSQNLRTQATGNMSHAGGRNSIAQGNISFVHGNESRATGEKSFAIGETVHAMGSSSIAMGVCAIAAHDNSFIWSGIGSPVVPISTTCVGQFYIKPDCGVYIDGDLTVTGTLNGTVAGGGGVASYSTLIGNGVLSSFTVIHNLSTSSVQAQVLDVTNNTVVYPLIQVPSTSSVNVFFEFVPSPSAYKVLILGGTDSQVNINGNLAYNILQANQATWNNTSSVVQASSTLWNSVYTTVRTNSGSWSSGSGVTQIVAGSNISISPVSGTGVVTINSTGGSATSIPTTGIHIPQPILKWRRPKVGIAPKVLPELFVTYTPTLTSTWLTPQTEVWISVYRRSKTKYWNNKPGIVQYQSGYVHPADTTRWAANSGLPLYAGNPGNKVFHTEFSFTSAGKVPMPYQQIPLTAFNPLEFYSNYFTSNTQVSASEFPFVWAGGYGIHVPRMRGRNSGILGKNLITYYEFKFAIPNPDTSSKYPKLFGPPAYLKVQPKFTNTVYQPVPRGSVGSQISFMTYSTNNK